MKNYNNTSEKQITRRILLTACATVLAVACTVSLSRLARADDVTPPSVPSTLQVPAGNEAFLKGFAVGTQNYICLPCPNATTPAALCPNTSGFAWTFFGPQATLFDDGDKQITTHFLSPNPDEGGTARATWQHSKDSSTVWGRLYTDPVNVTPGAIPWLLLQVVGADEGPTGGDKLADTTFIHRLNTAGGVAPATGCTMSTDVGKRALVEYETDYFFYKATDSDDD